jgi:hypothetical protein
MSEDPKKSAQQPSEASPKGPGADQPAEVPAPSEEPVDEVPLEQVRPGTRPSGETMTSSQLLGRKVPLSGDEPRTPFGSFAT